MQSVKSYFGDKKVAVITGVMADKDYRYMASRIAEVADTLFCIRPDNPRALSAEDYALVFESLGVRAVACDSVDVAVESAVSHAKITGASVVSLGSLYMYGEVADAVKKYRE